MRPFRNLKVWQRAHATALEIYRQTAGFPSEERFGLTSQIRRAAVSIPCNIVEGAKRKHPNDFARFLNIAEGSAAEVAYLAYLSKELGFWPGGEKIEDEMNEICAMLCALRTKVEQSC